MKKIYKDIKINYEFYNNDSNVNLIFLHGWGQNIQMMQPIAKPFIKRNNILIIDLPGFGKSEEPKEVWSIYDYSSLVNDLINELKINNPILIGHSFGGKIALVYASLYEVKKLVVFGSPFCKEIKELPLKTKIYKFVKKTPVLNILAKPLANMIGSTDYKNSSGIMRSIMVKHVNLDVIEDVKKINAPTLIIWGDKDEAVNVNRAYELEKLIKDSGVVVYENATHYAYLERLNEVTIVLSTFFS
jgi:pimeloyl-ACP methyl ester carboxylesterase